MIKPPLILTLSIEKEASLFFNTLRQKHFPPSRNFIDAHLTLFHALPNEDSIVDVVNDACKLQNPFELSVEKPVSIGKGVAYKIESNELVQLHKKLQNKWLEFLTLQDRQKLWPHITVQNKVPVPNAQELLNELKEGFTPFAALAIGLQLWEYLNGPWTLVEDFIFKNVEALE
ncbi:MAG: 2'-5' RNA ligase family protein [Segetibacter sp.]|nr:2'-5' RNA ligase family protein [Segetibacter sp.]